MSASKATKMKDLYMSATLEGLDFHIHKKMDALRVLPAKKCCAHADKMFLAAGEAVREGDEERAYVLFMKYMEALNIVRKKPEYKKDERYFNSLIGLKNFEQALQSCEKLQRSLTARYTLKKEEAEAKKLIEHLDQHRPANSLLSKPGSIHSSPLRPSSKAASESPEQDSTSITCAALNALMRQESSSYLIIDTRPAADFAASRLHSRFLVSVPAELLKPGATAPALESQLPDDCRQLFARRRTVDRLVLLDWTGGVSGGGTAALDTLRDAMTKWDVSAYRTKPVTLSGGYQMWLHTYPMLTTNPQVSAPSAVPQPAAGVSLTFAYPSLDEPATPQVDRSVKPGDVPATHPASSSVPAAPDHPQGPAEFPSMPPLSSVTGQNDDLDIAAATERADELLRRISSLKIDAGRPSPTLPSNSPSASPVHPSGSTSRTPSTTSVASSVSGTALPPASSGSVKERPGIPSRSLKPHIQDEASARRRIELARSRLEVEREWQEVRRSREQQAESEMRVQLQAKEETLLAEIRRLETEQREWETQQEQLRAENEALKQRLASYEQGATTASSSPATLSESAERLESERRVQELEVEQARIAALVDDARRRREREQELERKRIEEEEERRKQKDLEAQKKKDEQEALRRRLAEEEAVRQRQVEAEAVRKQQEAALLRKKEEEETAKRKQREEEAAKRKKREEEAAKRKQKEDEEQRRLEEQERRAAAADRQQDQVYLAKLKDSGSSSGGGLKRSHSSPFIARLGDDQAPASTPNFSRDNKPFAKNRRGDVQAARTRRFAPAYGSVGPALTGVKNLGNTCYMNAVVQCVNNTPSFNEFFVGEAYQDFINYDSELSHGEAAQELAAAVKVLWSGHYRSVALYDLKDVMGRYHPPFRGSSQQDAHEFLMYLLEFLHEDLNEVQRKKPLKEQENDNIPDQRASQAAWDDFKSNNRSFILNLFWGQMKSTLHCSHCGNQSVKWETFSHLSVPMPKRSSKCSLQECLRLYMAGERIEGWRCPRCKRSTGATKALDLWHLPPILVIHIQRFYNDGLWRKKQSNVDFPLENLDMSPYVINAQARYLRHKYHLYGVVNHYGTMEGGHYTAFCKSLATGRWHKFDDHEVYQMNNGAVQTSAGYILFYSAIDGKLQLT